MNRTLLMVCGVFLWLSASSAAADVKFCIQTDSSYADSGFGEVFWPTNEPHWLRGAKVSIIRNGVTLLSNVYLGDGIGSSDPGAGCTPTISLPLFADNGSYVIVATTEAKVNNNNVRVFQYPSTSAMYTVSSNFGNSSGPGTKKVLLNIATTSEVYRAFNTFSAAVFAVYRHNGGLSNANFDVQYDEDGLCVGGTNDGDVCTGASDCPGGSCDIGGNDNENGKVVMNVFGQDQKFMIAHEMAHRLGSLAADLTGSGPYDPAAASCPSEPATADHSLRSMELQRAAVHEGFAHFYSADVWNDHNEDKCSFRYYKNVAGQHRTIDCDNASPNAPLAYMETAPCGNSEALEGMGVELDWMRTFWDLHKHSGGVDFVEMIEWIRDAPSWNVAGKEKCAYDFLNFAASSHTDFVTKWHAAADENGINHSVTPCGDTSCACFMLL